MERPLHSANMFSSIYHLKKSRHEFYYATYHKKKNSRFPVT